ncbi:MAG: hypothetical protein RIG26_04305 [Thalassospira sp.]|uniref:hypothetical protein n=1 Tax=Thalassospira sp. TaxID=1912094 RepID=UPI0032EFD1F1
MSEKMVGDVRQLVLKDQAAGVVVETINTIRIQDEIVQLAKQDAAFKLAIEQMDKVREFLSRPQNILGSSATKHGEIAEQIEVGIRNARQALAQQEMTATFEGVHRTGPTDFLLDGLSVQSKFINGTTNSLRQVIAHLEKYPNHPATGGYYILPKDTYEAVQKIINGEHVEGLKKTTELGIRAYVTMIEKLTGKPFQDAVKPSVVNYPDVQVMNAEKTLDNETDDLAQTNKNKKEEIAQEHQPSLREAGKAALIGAAVAGTMTLATSLYNKHRDGKNMFRGDFTEDDWKDIGLETLKGTAGGALAGGSIYLMTNYAGMAAPFASAVVSALKGLTSLSESYADKTITREEFLDLGMVVCTESACVGVSTLIGQAAIPIPILGAVIGSLAGKMITEFVNRQDETIARKLKEDMEVFKGKLDETLSEILENISAEIDKLNNLTMAAFDPQLNTRLTDRSIQLAKEYGVADRYIILNEDALDAFMR